MDITGTVCVYRVGDFRLHDLHGLAVAQGAKVSASFSASIEAIGQLLEASE